VDLEFRFALPKLLSISTTHFGLLGQSKYLEGWGGEGIKELSSLMKESMAFKGGLLDVFKNIGNHGFYISIGYLDFLRTMIRK
jgi:hypothetical protein